MPHTLGHLGLQGIVTRTVIKGAELKWIVLGAIIPDIPWIVQRLVLAMPIPIDPYDLRLYAIVQSSLLFSLVLSAALAVVAGQPARTLAVLALGATLHLLLDALETKWGNGVLFLAPLSWELSSVRLFWPEGLVSTLLALVGLVYIGYAWKRLPVPPLVLARPPLGRCLLGGALILGYLLVPLTLLPAAEAADAHYLRTLRLASERTGRAVEIDRPFYQKQADGNPGGNTVRIFTGEQLPVQGLQPPSSGTVSIKGRFLTDTTLEITAYHVHPSAMRDAASYLGLALVAAVWARAVVAGMKRPIASGPDGDDVV